MAKRSAPVTQGFGRVIYLTLIRRLSNNQVQQTGWDTEEGLEYLEKLRSQENTITLCFDPWRNIDNNTKHGQLNTRIDFQVKHMGDAGIGNNGFYVTANIDVWNIGPALEQFFDAYNAYKSDGQYKRVETKKYAAVLQVGFKDKQERTTIFAGHIASFICDRQQNNSTVDNVWHFLCQYPDPQQNTDSGDNKVKVKNGETYTPPTKKEWNATQTFTSWEEFLKTAICYHKQTIYELRPTNVAPQTDTFSVFPIVKEDDKAQMSVLTKPFIEIPMVPTPQRIYMNRLDFDKYFKIEYRVSRNSPLLPTVKELWQQKIPVPSWNLDVSSIQASITSIARAVNCHARLELDENTGKQTIYIYPAGWAEVDIVYKGPADYTIIDYQNLTKPPQVSANMFHLDMILEPAMRPGSIIELQVSEAFMNIYKHPTFEPTFSMGNTATVFAGNNFIGLAQMAEDEKKRNAIASSGNIFNTKFIATIVEHKGSSHTTDWTTSVDCYGVVAKNGKVVSA